MSKTLAELEAEFAEINRIRDEKQKAANEAAKEFSTVSYKQTALAAEIEKARREASQDGKLVEKFEAARAEFDLEVAKHIQAAAAELDKAKKLSEKTGIPFKSPVIDIGSVYDCGDYDIYVPKSLPKKWEALIEESDGLITFLYNEFGDCPSGDELNGWSAAWAPSSMKC